MAASCQYPLSSILLRRHPHNLWRCACDLELIEERARSDIAQMNGYAIPAYRIGGVIDRTEYFHSGGIQHFDRYHRSVRANIEGEIRNGPARTAEGIRRIPLNKVGAWSNGRHRYA